MIPIQQTPEVAYLVGGVQSKTRPLKPFDEILCVFINALSSELMRDREANNFPDVIAFAFWCRKANIAKLRSAYDNGTPRLGLGRIFHIAPSNVAVNFAFSYIFGLLSGNANYVRLPSKKFPQIDVICQALNKVLDQEQFCEIRGLTHIFRYGHNDDVTSVFSSHCDGRLIWGGNETIKKIRKLPISERGMDIAFADRYSFCVIGVESILEASKKELNKLAANFYNDTYLMDQNACSSPHLVVWIGVLEDVELAKKKFWTSVHGVVKDKYQISTASIMDKYTLLCQNAIELDGIKNIKRFDNFLYCIELDYLPENIDSLRGSCGYFYEYQTGDINTLSNIVNQKYQTVTYYGLDKAGILDFVLDNRLTGIDRIVPIGKALDIGLIWDGHDIIRTLSRVIDVR